MSAPKAMHVVAAGYVCPNCESEKRLSPLGDVWVLQIIHEDDCPVLNRSK